MHYNYNDLKKISINSDKNYYIKRHAYYNSLKDALIDGQKIYQRMRYLVQTHEEYIDISFIVAISQTNGKTAIKTKEKTKGRPKYKIIGKRVKPHIHIACTTAIHACQAEKNNHILSHNYSSKAPMPLSRFKIPSRSRPITSLGASYLSAILFRISSLEVSLLSWSII